MISNSALSLVDLTSASHNTKDSRSSFENTGADFYSFVLDSISQRINSAEKNNFSESKPFEQNDFSSGEISNYKVNSYVDEIASNKSYSVNNRPAEYREPENKITSHEKTQEESKDDGPVTDTSKKLDKIKITDEKIGKNTKEIDSAKDKKGEAKNLNNAESLENSKVENFILAILSSESFIEKLSSKLKDKIKDKDDNFKKDFQTFLREKATTEIKGIIKSIDHSHNGKFDLNEFKVEKLFEMAEKSNIFKDILKRFEKEIIKFTQKESNTLTNLDIKDGLLSIANELKKTKGEIKNFNEQKENRDSLQIKEKLDISSDAATSIKKQSLQGDGDDFLSGKDRKNHDINFSASKSHISGKEVNKGEIKVSDFSRTLQEIIDRAKISVRDNSNATFSVKLFPKDLGNVNVNLLYENGVLSGRFIVNNEDAKAALLNNIEHLKFQLSEAGIELGNFTVDVNHSGSGFARDGSELDEVIIVPGLKNSRVQAAENYEIPARAKHDGIINMVI
ncbi:MAG TPA: flagellar hook-length control protein FliK [Spirochaetota bacterium]|nr:flagellar hook-length control protein FliK [Spirochaetota bacterium]